MNVKYQVTDGIAVVTIDRVERRNAVDETTAEELFGAFARFESDDACNVAVLTGAGGHFCAGVDLLALDDGQIRNLETSGRGPLGPTRMVLSKPVLAAVEGYAVAGGLELALWCDLRIAASDAVFGVFNRRFGVSLVDMGTMRLPRLIGQSVAMDIILTGRPVNAVEAKQIGLVNRIAPSGEALNAAVALAKELAAFPQIAVRNDKLSVIEQWNLPLHDALENESRHGMASFATGEAQRGAKRFAEGDGRHASPST